MIWAAIFLAGTANAAPLPDAFHTGPVISTFGPVATIDSDIEIPVDTDFKVAFDVADAGDVGAINRTLSSAARFINMHVEAGIPVDQIKVAVVVHGRASTDMTKQNFYGALHDGAQNANAAAIATLLAHNVDVIVCGQSATAHNISKSDLLPGVQMALSAMTAHALLQQQEFTLNPF